METFITIVIILLMLIFNKPLFALAGGLVFRGVVLVVMFVLLKVLLFGYPSGQPSPLTRRSALVDL